MEAVPFVSCVLGVTYLFPVFTKQCLLSLCADERLPRVQLTISKRFLEARFHPLNIQWSKTAIELPLELLTAPEPCLKRV